MPVITTIQDLKDMYERRVPRMFYDYCESGSWTEQTFHDNISDFSKLRLRQRVAVDMANRTTNTKMIGQTVSMPVALAPVGLTSLRVSRAVTRLTVYRPNRVWIPPSFMFDVSYTCLANFDISKSRF